MHESTFLVALASVELPTLGHALDEGFCDPRISRLAPGPRLLGTAVTVDLEDPDAIAVNRAIVTMRPGDVLVIRVAGGRHAPVGAVTVAAAAAQGAVGIVVDGPVTDRSALAASALAVYADGTTARTTKLLGSDRAKAGVPVRIGGVLVRPGDIVAGDENGVVVFDPRTLDADLIERARLSDAAEPHLLRRIAQGEPLGSLLSFTPAPEEETPDDPHR